jgi:hypothetical protein
MSDSKGATEHGEILGVREHRPAIDQAMPGDDAVTNGPFSGNLELAFRVPHQAPLLDEALGIEKKIESLARGQLAALMLLVDLGAASTQERQAISFLEFLER